jgi:hypothetical protein
MERVTRTGIEPKKRKPWERARPLIVTRRTACELLGRAPRTIKTWQAQGRLTPIYIDGMVNYRYDEIEALAKGDGKPGSQSRFRGEE